MPVFHPNFSLKVKIFFLLACFKATLVLGGIYYHTFRQDNYAPIQPVEFSHQTHVGLLGMDCKACHNWPDKSPRAGIPDTASCLDCHKHIKRDSFKIEPLLKAADKNHPGFTGEPVQWIKVNRIARHANFNHQAHTTRGVGCSECHGDVSTMARISVNQTRGMKWCMDCHQSPSSRLRPMDSITDQNYTPAGYIKNNRLLNTSGQVIETESELYSYLGQLYLIRPKTDCTACHQ